MESAKCCRGQVDDTQMDKHHEGGRGSGRLTLESSQPRAGVAAGRRPGSENDVSAAMKELREEKA